MFISNISWIFALRIKHIMQFQRNTIAPKVNAIHPKHDVFDTSFTRGASLFIRTNIPKNTSGIYMIWSSVNNKEYIGSAINLRRRKNEHFKDLKRNKHYNPRLQNHFNKYGEDVFTFGIIKFCIKEKLIEREQFSINLLHPEFNICQTAGSSLGVKNSEKTKLKRIISRKIYNKTSEGIQYLQSISKPIDQYDLKGNLLNSYKSISEAKKKTKILYSTISLCLQSKTTMAGGFLWAERGELIDKKLEIYNNKTKNKPVYQYNLNGDFIAEYKNINEASKTNKIYNSHIYNCTLGILKSAGGFFWVAEKDNIYSAINNKKVAKLNHGGNKPVDKYSLKGAYKNTYKSILEASKQTGILPSDISACVNNKIRFAGNFLWVRKGEPIDNKLEKFNSSLGLKPVYQFSLDGKFISKYKSGNEAGRQIGICPALIHTYLREVGSRAGGFIFTYGNPPTGKQISRANILYIRINCKVVSQYNLKGEFLIKYRSISEAARRTNIHSSQISGCINNLYKNKSAGGFIWKTT